METRTAPRLRTFGILALIVITLTGCGVVRVNELQQMTAEDLAAQSDQFICDEGARIEIISSLPVVWIRELKKRDLWSCVSQYRDDGDATQVIIQQD